MFILFPIQGGLFTLKRTHSQVDEAAQKDEAEPPVKKTKSEIYQEIIAKSKQYKAENRLGMYLEYLESLLLLLIVNSIHSARMRDSEQVDSLDTDFGTLRKLLAPQTKRKTDATMNDDDEDEDEYDKLAHELEADMERQEKARTSTRVKTDEELAMLEAERLQQLELDRKRRMSVGKSGNEDLVHVPGNLVGACVVLFFVFHSHQSDELISVSTTWFCLNGRSVRR